MENKRETQVCVICKNKFEDYGNNPEPYANTGQCCDKYNTETVIPARIAHLERERDKMEGDREFYRAVLTLINFTGERPVAINYEHKKIDFEDGVSYFLYNYDEKDQYNFIHGNRDDVIKLIYEYSAFSVD